MDVAAARIAYDLLSDRGAERVRQAEAVLVEAMATLDRAESTAEHVFGLYEEVMRALTRARRGELAGLDQARALLRPLAGATSTAPRALVATEWPAPPPTAKIRRPSFRRRVVDDGARSSWAP